MTQTKEALASMTPERALSLLKEGNRRYVDGKSIKRNLLIDTQNAAFEQYPFAVILGCVDSRVPLELVFDLGIGDIFGIRIAGNIVNNDILGSMELACNNFGSKHILVLGHTNCGLMQASIDQMGGGHLTGLIQKLNPAVMALKKISFQEAPLNVNELAKVNVLNSIDEIIAKSQILKGLMNQRRLSISGAMYDVETGKVTFNIDKN